MMKAYKNFDNDLKCRNIQFEIGKTYKLDNDEPLELCRNGFHYHKVGLDCFKYYPYKNSRLCEIEVIGDSIDGNDKSCCKEFKIIKEIDRDSDEWKTLLNLHSNTGLHNSGDYNSRDRNSGNCNSGNWNSGNWNSGDRNSGYCNSGNCNSGDRNSGNWNSGDRNSGNWNSVNRSSGFFNSKQEDIVMVFNKPCKVSEWENSKKPLFIFFGLTKEVNGKTVSIDYKEAWKKAYSNATKEDIELLKALPNFDAKVFKEISGINILKEGE
jgi:hypothetical protein